MGWIFSPRTTAVWMRTLAVIAVAIAIATPAWVLRF